jgi:tetratricopeptide (TPR) repeat protein
MMRLAERITSVCSVASSTTDEGQRLRSRLRGAVGLALLLSGLLFAVGLGIAVVAAAMLVVMIGFGVAVTRALPRYWPRISSHGGATAREIRERAWQAMGVCRTTCRTACRMSSSSATSLVHQGRASARRFVVFAREGRQLVVRARDVTVARLRAATGQLEPAWVAQARQSVDPDRQALALNAAGTRQRRAGSYAEAAELHRRALELLQTRDDQRTVALTQNNLALALSHLGKHTTAIALFEEAANVMRALGDEEHEGRIIANLGLAHRRHGHDERWENVLELALTKIPPASRAYRAIEAELRTAS